jgi:hypothetical protein
VYRSMSGVAAAVSRLICFVTFVDEKWFSGLCRHKNKTRLKAK